MDDVKLLFVTFVLLSSWRQVNGQTTYYGATIGSSITLECETPIEENNIWKWYFDKLDKIRKRADILCDFEKDGNSCNNYTIGNVVHYSNATHTRLQISSLDFENTKDNYTCNDEQFEVRESFNIAVVGEKILMVVESGKNTSIDATIEMKVGELVEIRCQVKYKKNTDTKHFQILLNDDANGAKTEVNEDLQIIERRFMVNVSKSTKEFVCRFKFPENYVQVSVPQPATIKIATRYCPENLDFYGHRNGTIPKNGLLNCSVQANPMVSVAMFYQRKDKMTKLHEGMNGASYAVPLDGIGEYTCVVPATTNNCSDESVSCNGIENRINITEVRLEEDPIKGAVSQSSGAQAGKSKTSSFAIHRSNLVLLIFLASIKIFTFFNWAFSC